MMAIIRSREYMPDENYVSIELLRSCITEHRKEIKRYKRLDDYYEGKHDILTRDLGGEDKGLPNNRLVANHAKYITDVAVGYFAGDPVKYDGPSMESITDTYKAIDIVSHDAEMAKDLYMFGVARELYYMTSDDVPIPKATCIDPRQLFLVVDDTVEYKSLFGVHYYERRDLNNTVIGWVINVYTKELVLVYQTNTLDTDGYNLEDIKDNYFGYVPVVEFWNNEEQQGDYEQQITLINAYNTLASDRVNDKEQFVDSILKIIGASLGDTEEEAGETVRLLKKYKVLELPGGQQADAAWLTKNLSEADTEVLRKAIKSDIHEFSMVPDLTDENFAANASGVAMKFKLFGLEQLAKTKERYFIQGLRERLKIFASILRVKGQAVGDIAKVTITMTRSLPSDDVETANMISQLKDIVSDETLLAQLSFIDDPAAEAKKVAKQKAVDLKQQQEAFGMPMNENGGDTGEEEE
jgi:SPP1 family phage portal protein